MSGRHTVDLARRGYAVTGVDRSPFLLAKARERALAIGTEAEWVEADMREFVRTDAFDLPLHGVSSRRPPRGFDIIRLQLNRSLARER